MIQKEGTRTMKTQDCRGKFMREGRSPIADDRKQDVGKINR